MSTWSRASCAAALIAALAIVSTGPARSQENDAKDPAARIARTVEDGIRARRVLHNARVGISIVDVATGDEIYARDPDGSYNVASNTKIMTTAAALALLGPDYSYKTAVYGEQLDGNGTIAGDIYLVGRGDPSLDDHGMRELAHRLRLAGITKVNGGVVVDDTYFDADVMPPHFDEQPDEQAAFRAPVGAVSLNFNATTVIVRPGASSGAPAVVTVEPANDYVKVVGSVRTTASGRTRVYVDSTEKRGALEVKVNGRIRTDSRPRKFRRRVAHPHLYAGAVFRAMLAAEGIRVARRKLDRDAVPAEATELASFKSRPMSVLLRGLGKYSNNFVAEMVLKTIGAESLDEPAPATWSDGQRAVREFLTEHMGLPADGFRYDNGSGLFDSNEFTPRQLTTVLRRAYRDFRYGPDLVATLAFAGADGTLSERMAEGPGERQVRAKTGTLADTSALSGYVAVDGVQPLAFSILVNDIPDMRGALSDARSLQDEVAEALIDYLRAVAADK